MFTLVSGFRLNPFPIRFVFLHVYVEIRKYLEPMFSKHYYSLIGLQLFNVSIHVHNLFEDDTWMKILRF